MNSPHHSQAKTDAWMLKADDRGHFNIEVQKDGTWMHEGAPIKRASLVKLFASVLHRDDDGQHWLVTPVEKGRIDVAVAPLLIVAIDVENPGVPERQSIHVTTQTGEHVTIDAKHPLSMMSLDDDDEVLPVVDIRNAIQAHFNRSSYYDLMALVEEGPAPDLALGLYSQGQFFKMEW